MSNPLISICMLTYNHESYIEEAIESVLEQTYTNWELIIVDNASTDSTRQKIEQMVAEEKRITFLPQDNNWYVSKGANIAMQAAQGEYIALFSGDDVFTPEKLEKHINFMLKNNLDLSFTWVTTIGANSKPSAPDVQRWFNDSTTTSKKEILRKYFKMYNVTCAPTAIIRSSILKATHLFDHRLLQTQDMEFWIRLMRHSNKVAILHKELTNYRVIESGENLSSNNTPEKINRTNFEMIQIWKELYALDNAILSNIFKIEITTDNKEHIIFTHLKKQKIDVWQYAMLLAMYQDLTKVCDITSPKFKLFFKEYGNFSIVSSDFVEQKKESITWLEEQLVNHKKALIDKDENISWLKEQLISYQKDWEEQFNIYQKMLKEKDEALQYKGTLKWFINKMLRRK